VKIGINLVGKFFQFFFPGQVNNRKGTIILMGVKAGQTGLFVFSGSVRQALDVGYPQTILSVIPG
jgi:hypothetical protein